jgi:FAD/FMN-containing dehydrogenase
LKYGTTKDYVLGLEAVLASGEIIRTGGKLVKDVAGYDLTKLLVGSEGTLAIVTEATLKLVPPPSYKKTMLAMFKEYMTQPVRYRKSLRIGSFQRLWSLWITRLFVLSMISRSLDCRWICQQFY